jgi:predicted alpha/beta superfamily hydrolase
MSRRSAPPLTGRRNFLLFAAGAAAAPAFAAPLVRGASRGRIETLRSVGPGDHPRVRVWLPSGYERGDRSHPTLYMLDGQFAFAGDQGGNNFAADERVARLAAAGRIPPTMVIAIDSLEAPADRFRQYMPQTIYDQSEGGLRAALDRALAGRPLVSAHFLRFLAKQLKPFVDARYRTRADRRDTAIAGASMAGPMAAAAFVEGQHSFGRAACISPQWPLYDQRMIDHPQLLSIWPRYFARLGDPAGRRLWMDHGTRMMDAGMAPHQTAIARRLAELGWRRGVELETRAYEGAGHAFARTAAQMDELLAWLLA